MSISGPLRGCVGAGVSNVAGGDARCHRAIRSPSAPSPATTSPSGSARPSAAPARRQKPGGGSSGVDTAAAAGGLERQRCVRQLGLTAERPYTVSARLISGQQSDGGCRFGSSPLTRWRADDQRHKHEGAGQRLGVAEGLPATHGFRDHGTTTWCGHQQRLAGHRVPYQRQEHDGDTATVTDSANGWRRTASHLSPAGARRSVFAINTIAVDCYIDSATRGEKARIWRFPAAAHAGAQMAKITTTADASTVTGA